MRNQGKKEMAAKVKDRLMTYAGRAAIIPAIVAGGFTHHAINEPLQASGLGNTGSVLAIAAALGMTVGYVVFLHVAINGVAPLPPERRRKASIAIWAGTAALMLGSAYPNIIAAGSGTATAIEDRTYIASVSAAGDRLKYAAETAMQIEAVLGNGATQLKAMAGLEEAGTISGTPSNGVLAGTIRAKAGVLEEAQSQMADARERMKDEIERFDRANDGMRQALTLRDKRPDERRVLMQRHGDEARSSAIAIGSAVPVAGLKSLSDSLSGPQVEPKWSSRADIRRNQEAGFRKLKDELRRIGKSIGRHAADLGEALKSEVAPYDPSPASILVLKHAGALTNIYALALVLDGLPLVLYLIACAMHDAARMPSSKDDRADDDEVMPDTPLGEHPHPNAARARFRNGRDQQ